MHIGGSDEFATGFPMIPVVRGRKEPAYLEMLRETFTEIIKRLHIAVRPVYVPVAMIKVNVRDDEGTVLVQELCYLGELFRLKVSDILENSLGNDNVEHFVTEPDRCFEKISFNQIWRRIMYSYINTIVLDIRTKDATSR